MYSKAMVSSQNPYLQQWHDAMHLGLILWMGHFTCLCSPGVFSNSSHPLMCIVCCWFKVVHYACVLCVEVSVCVRVMYCVVAEWGAKLEQDVLYNQLWICGRYYTAANVCNTDETTRNRYLWVQVQWLWRQKPCCTFFWVGLHVTNSADFLQSCRASRNHVRK